MPPQEQIPDGTTFEKEFDVGFFTGTVSSFDEKTKQYRVFYEDGDAEDMTRGALKRLIAKTIKRQQPPKPCSRKKRKNATAVLEEKCEPECTESSAAAGCSTWYCAAGAVWMCPKVDKHEGRCTVVRVTNIPGFRLRPEDENKDSGPLDKPRALQGSNCKELVGLGDGDMSTQCERNADCQRENKHNGRCKLVNNIVLTEWTNAQDLMGTKHEHLVRAQAVMIKVKEDQGEQPPRYPHRYSRRYTGIVCLR